MAVPLFLIGIALGFALALWLCRALAQAANLETLRELALAKRALRGERLDLNPSWQPPRPEEGTRPPSLAAPRGASPERCIICGRPRDAFGPAPDDANLCRMCARAGARGGRN